MLEVYFYAINKLISFKCIVRSKSDRLQPQSLQRRFRALRPVAAQKTLSIHYSEPTHTTNHTIPVTQTQSIKLSQQQTKATSNETRKGTKNEKKR